MSSELIKIYEYREMLKNLVKKDLRSRYKGSVLGFFWTFLNPFLMLIVYSMVFSIVLRIEIPHYNYALFLFVGLVPWLFFQTTMQQSTSIIIANSNLIKKIYFPRIILPLSTTITNLVNTLFTFLIVFAALLFFKAPLNKFYLYLPLIIIIQTVFTMACSIILSCITVYFRDIEHVISVLLMGWFYVTPIIYPVDYVPVKYLKFIYINPMASIIDSYRNILMFNKGPGIKSLLLVFVFSLFLLIIGYLVFDHLQKKFAEEI
jgi:lipopolysaccharide transport system permease protein